MAIGLKTTRDRNRQRMNDENALDREIGDLPKVRDPERRRECEADTELWLRTYFPGAFSKPFTNDQREWILEIEERMDEGGDKAIAAPRGEGKTTIAERVILKAILTGRIRFALLVRSTGPDARESLDNIKGELEELRTPLAADYPEACFPIEKMDRASQRAKKQTHLGEFTLMRWEVDVIRLARIPGKACSGAMIATRGLDAAIRGINKRTMRPDFVLIDDPETRESAEHQNQCDTREQIIEKDIGGLGAMGKRMGRLMLCTLQNKTCLAAKYTDHSAKPWNGKRYRLLVELPLCERPKQRDDDPEPTYLWQEYVELQKQLPKTATEFYIAHRNEMERGAIVSNPNRYISGQELSALQHCYNLVARIGWDNFCTEFQNDPPEDTGPQESGITAVLVASRLHDYPHERLPDGCETLTIGVDVGLHRCHWAAIGWMPGAVGYICDYGQFDVPGTSPEDKVQLPAERAIGNALVNLRQQWIENPYATEAGEVIEPKLVMIDSGSGLHTNAVYEFVRAVGHRPYVAAKGFGKGNGMTAFWQGKQAPTRRIGDHWFQARQDNAPDIWLHGFDADYWKRFVHQRFLTPTKDAETGDYRAGTLSLWRSKQSHRHAKFARQIEAEIWTVDFTEGKTGAKEYWERRHRDNHYLDACAMACAAGNMAGIKLVGEKKPTGPRVSLQEYAKHAKGAA
jgi:hypothetical protein